MPIRLPSIGVDFKVAEAVDQVLLIVGMIPKKIFKAIRNTGTRIDSTAASFQKNEIDISANRRSPI